MTQSEAAPAATDDSPDSRISANHSMAEGPTSSLQEYIDSWRNIVLGRVFTHDGALHFVLEVGDGGLCRVSRRHGARTEIIHMPLGEVVLRVKEDA